MRDSTSTAGLSWLGAAVRALHPGRLLACGAALGVSLLICALALAWFEQEPVRPEAWWQRPHEELRRLGERVVAGGSAAVLARSFLLIGLLAAVWGPAGGWVVRSELLRLRPEDEPMQITPTRLVWGKAGSLSLPIPLSLFLTLFFLLPGVLAGLFNRVPLLGPVFVAVVLPVLLLFSLFAVFVLCGVLAYPLLPAAVAAEGADPFEALARGYSYFYQRTLSYAWWSGLVLAAAAVPIAAVLLLLHDRPSEPGQGAAWAVIVLALSLFWSLQGLIYLRMRRLVDEVPENEVWDGPVDTGTQRHAEDRPPDEAEHPAPPQSGEGQERPAEEEPEGRDEPLTPKRTRLSFRDTLEAAPGMDLSLQVVLLGGALWVSLVLTAASLAAWEMAGRPGQAFTPAAVRDAVVGLGGRQPPVLVGLVAGVLLLGTLGVARVSRVAARMAAVRVVFGQGLPMAAARPFAGQTRGQGLVSAVFLAAGIGLLLAAGTLVPAAAWRESPWAEPIALGVLSVPLLVVAAWGLGAVGVHGRREETRPGAAATFLANGLETLAAAAVSLAAGTVRFALVAGIAWLTWFLMCESISWWGGEKVRWLRWGLDGRLRPEPGPGVYRVASLLVGVWFLLFAGMALMYPVAYLLRWGAACYLLARRKVEDSAASPLELTEVEQAALVAQQKSVRKRLERRKGAARPRLGYRDG